MSISFKQIKNSEPVIAETTETVFAISRKLYLYIANCKDYRFVAKNGVAVFCGPRTIASEVHDHGKIFHLPADVWNGRRVHIEKDLTDPMKVAFITHAVKLQKVLEEAAAQYNLERTTNIFDGTVTSAKKPLDLLMCRIEKTPTAVINEKTETHIFIRGVLFEFINAMSGNQFTSKNGYTIVCNSSGTSADDKIFFMNRSTWTNVDVHVEEKGINADSKKAIINNYDKITAAFAEVAELYRLSKDKALDGYTTL